MNELYSLIVPEGIEVMPEMVVLVRMVLVFTAIEFTSAVAAFVGGLKR